MKKRDFLLSAMLSTLLLTANLSADHIECKGGKCFINLSKLAPTKTSHVKIQKTVPFKLLKEEHSVETIALNHEEFIMQENKKIIPHKNNELETIVFPPSSYVMNKEEREAYYSKVTPTAEESSIEKNIIMEKMTLPTSAYYCENHQKAIYNEELKAYQCTI